LSDLLREVRADSWEGRSAPELAILWAVPAVHLFAELGSTNDVARRLVSEGAPHGTVVISELQTKGRGRAGRPWASPAGAGLWISLLLRPGGKEGPGALPLLIGLAAAACLDETVPETRAGIKWPNDLQVGTRKIGGILCESTWSGSAPVSIIAGLGLNLLQREADFPHDFRDRATSVKIETGRDPDRLALASCLVRAILRRVREPLMMTSTELSELESRNTLLNAFVRVTESESGGALTTGTALGVDTTGALLVRDAAGILHRIQSGTVRLAEPT
jgi:BirA family transcriptional regulator, biotin operon repressor / biotin---[acetyl-CoA-carboxylase] ligase